MDLSPERSLRFLCSFNCFINAVARPNSPLMIYAQRSFSRETNFETYKHSDRIIKFGASRLSFFLKQRIFSSRKKKLKPFWHEICPWRMISWQYGVYGIYINVCLTPCDQTSLKFSGPKRDSKRDSNGFTIRFNSIQFDSIQFNSIQEKKLSLYTNLHSLGLI